MEDLYILKKHLKVKQEDLANIIRTIDYDDCASNLYEDDKFVICGSSYYLVDYLQHTTNTCHEMIGFRPDDNVKIYFDFDCKELGDKSHQEITTCIKEELPVVIANTVAHYTMGLTYMSTSLNSIDLKYLAYTILSACSRDILSLHIIFHKLMMKFTDLKEFMRRMKECNKNYWLEYLDLKVYASHWSSLRTIYAVRADHTGRLVPLNSSERNTEDFFVRLPDPRTTILMTNCITPAYQNYISQLQDYFLPNQIRNLPDVDKGLGARQQHFLIQIKYTSVCGLCGDPPHSNSFYATLKNDKSAYTISKYGNGCAKRILPIEKVSSHDICYNIALKYFNLHCLHKDETLRYWEYINDRWCPLHVSEIGTYILQHKDNKDLTDDERTIIETAKERFHIEKNLKDQLIPLAFMSTPANIIMLEDGFFDIQTRQHVNTKQYRSDKCCSVKSTDLVTEETTRRKEELKVVLINKIIPPHRTTARTTLDELFAMILIGAKKDRIVHFYGESNMGKTVICTLLSHMLNANLAIGYAAIGTSKILTKDKGGIRGELALYEDKLLVRIPELTQDTIIDEYRIKMLYEHDITADKKFVNFKTFPNRAVTIIDGNYSLICPQYDKSINKRIQTLQFKSKFLDTEEYARYFAEYGSNFEQMNYYAADPEILDNVEKGYYNSAMFSLCLDMYDKHYKSDISYKPIRFSLPDYSSLFTERLYSEVKEFVNTNSLNEYDLRELLSDKPYHDNASEFLQIDVIRRLKALKLPCPASFIIEIMKSKGYVFKKRDESEWELD